MFHKYRILCWTGADFELTSSARYMNIHVYDLYFYFQKMR